MLWDGAELQLHNITSELQMRVLQVIFTKIQSMVKSLCGYTGAFAVRLFAMTLNTHLGFLCNRLRLFLMTCRMCGPGRGDSFAKDVRLQ